ncbi:MAG: ABC transporter ATP-binding protein, partial [Ectothiorhodospira sp.]
HGAARRKARRREEAERRRRQKPLRDRVARLERTHEDLERQRADLEQALADPALYEEAARAHLQELLGRQARVERDLAQVEGEWLEACEALEQGGTGA